MKKDRLEDMFTKCIEELLEDEKLLLDLLDSKKTIH